MLSLSLGVVAATASLAFGQTPIGTFYPPNLNDTAYITNTTGTYGGVYQASTTNSSGYAPYGTYDYCAMPHPRVTEYPMPSAVSNGSVKASLVYLEYLQRHQRRTPYNLFPAGEAAPFYCDNIKPYLYAAPQSGQQPLPVYQETYTSPTNPFVATYDSGTCQYPQLTIGGLLDGYQHGNDLYALYGQKLGLIPSTPGNSTWFRSSSSALTQDSAGAVLRGIWPNFQGSLPLHQQATGVDTVNEGFTCAAQARTLSAIEATPAWKQHLNETASLQQGLEAVVGNLTSAWTATYDHLEDNFQGRLCNGYSLPCSKNNSADCVTMDQADEVFRAGDWEWNYYWRANPNATLYIQLIEGLFIGEILDGLQQVANGTSPYSYRHVFVHDGDIGPILGALGINVLRWPGMASNIAFEVWKTTTNALYARVLYSGQPIETIHGTLDWIPLSQLMGILRPFVPVDIVAMCNA